MAWAVALPVVLLEPHSVCTFELFGSAARDSPDADTKKITAFFLWFFFGCCCCCFLNSFISVKAEENFLGHRRGTSVG